MSDLEEVFAAIDQRVASPGEPDRSGEILSHMEDAIHRPGGLVALADRYGDREEAELLRPLTFLLARTISHDGPASGVAITMQLIGRMRCSDDSARSNLATALHLLAMYRAVPADAPSPRLASFLLGCLQGSPALRDAAVPALASVLAAGVRVSEGQRQALRAAVETLRDENAEWAAAALARLRDEVPQAGR